MDRITRLVLLFLVTLIVSASLAQGCAIFAGPIAEKIASGVEKYCEEPLSYRQLYRNTVNASLAHTGHLVHVHCSGDPPATP